MTSLLPILISAIAIATILNVILKRFNHELILDGNTHVASVLVGRINKSRLLAKETSKLKYLYDYSTDEPKQAIKKAEREQARLLDIISQYFNALKDGEGMMNIRAFHGSFIVLSEIIEDAISNIMKRSRLDAGEYERSNTLSAERNIDAPTKALLLSSMKHMDSLKSLFGTLAGSYNQLVRERASENVE